MDPGSSSAKARGDDAKPSNMGGRDHDAILRSVTQQVMAEMTRGLGERSCTIEQFMRIRPPSFSGGANLLMVENWVQDMKDMLAVLLEEQRPDTVAVIWSHFREILFKRYFLAIVRSVKAANFLHLTEGLMIVQQYAVRFIELSQFAPYLVPDEERKVWNFEEGLR
ncbi:uncharacterized protein LOC131166699 [Malania oleifera]|uniref:uncharacterized protein LOC131166699 n=1 Tax=Malania oleifera TaxID=397392 RepID=UPI0025ADC3CC|nr:uncharacterized protein LOC131166699 [Malania oleifera]